LNSLFRLANVFVILAQAADVLGIFFNVLALQFISELDDIAFALAKKDVWKRNEARLHGQAIPDGVREAKVQTQQGGKYFSQISLLRQPSRFSGWNGYHQYKPKGWFLSMQFH